jgi:predicted naringenin-chalcone synthase
MHSVFLNQFQVEKPKNCIPQSDLLNWIIKCHQFAHTNSAKKLSDLENGAMTVELIEKLFQRYGVKSNLISQRYLESNDIHSLNFANNEIYKITDLQKNGSDIMERAQFFSHRAFEIFHQFYNMEKQFDRPDHLIHVTCTGYISPSAAQRIVTESNWGKSTDITHAYHMGCYAALPAVRLAKSIVQSEVLEQEQYTTDIVHNEMCGLHMNPLAQTPEQMVVQTLFADGHIKYSATNLKQDAGKNLRVISLHEKVVPNSQQDMSWIPAPWGMQMNLSREVPEKIKLELKKFSTELFAKAGITYEKAINSIFAIHPGGPKIIDSVQESLELRPDQITESKKILFERGNMSSATLPHVWNEILEKKYPVGTQVISYAFGPGLTLFGAVFEVC